MSNEIINKEELTIHKESVSEEGKVIIKDDVYIIVTQAFCPNGHNLVGKGKHTFDGYPGICLNVTDGEKEGILEISPFHGDESKLGIDFEKGKTIKITCPECGCEFPVLEKCSRGEGSLRKIYLSPKLTDAHMIALCDKWGCYMSSVIDDNELFSEFESTWE
jgi:hypothetical protein